MPDRLDRSLNEVEALARKAARGAGYEWGLADEAAAATRWLCAQGLDGCAVLSQWLRQREALGEAALEVGALQPQVSEMTSSELKQASSCREAAWQAGALGTCPVLAGVALSDRAALLALVDLSVSKVHCPEILGYFVQAVAVRLQRVYSIRWSSESWVVGPQGVYCFPSFEQQYSSDKHTDPCDAATCAELHCRVLVSDGSTDQMTSVTDRMSRARVTSKDWQCLENFAYKTYAPATDASRLLGAGAGLSDND